MDVQYEGGLGRRAPVAVMLDTLPSEAQRLVAALKYLLEDREALRWRIRREGQEYQSMRVPPGRRLLSPREGGPGCTWFVLQRTKIYYTYSPVDDGIGFCHEAPRRLGQMMLALAHSR